jgi:glycosyltransferase involved in cell wall biosynthesis
MILSCDQPGGRPFYPLDPKVRRLYVPPVKMKWGQGIFRHIKEIRRAVLSACPNVSIGFMHTAYIPLSWASVCTNIPVVASEHISFDHYRGRFFEYFAIFLAMPFLSAMTAQSTRIVAGYPWLLRRKMHVVPNPVNLDWGRIQKRREAGTEKIILNIGRLTLQKDQITLIHAFDMIADRFPDWCLHIYGDGELKDTIKKAIARSQASSRIKLFKPVRDISNIYKNADIFVNPAHYESFGLVTAEAMAHQLPAVGFVDCPGTNELIIDGYNGLLVSGVNRAMALAQKLEILMMDSDLRTRLGHNGPQSIEQYNPNFVVQVWEDVIRKVVG